jgi:hypothetical protein
VAERGVAQRGRKGWGREKEGQECPEEEMEMGKTGNMGEEGGGSVVPR